MHHESQGAGRFDNPAHYTAGYVSALPQAAIGEVFGGLNEWRPEMLRPPYLPDSVRALVAFRAPELQLIDLDDPQTLTGLGIKPSDVVRRNRDRTQEVALQVFLEHGDEVDGFKWWSYYRPEWTVAVIWNSRAQSPDESPFDGLLIESVEELSLDTPSLLVAADVLNKVMTS